MTLSNRHKQFLSEAEALLRQVASERQVTYDDRTQKWQDSERGCAFAQATEEIEEVADQIEELR